MLSFTNSDQQERTFVKLHSLNCNFVYKMVLVYSLFLFYLFLAVLDLCCFMGFSLVAVSRSYSLAVVQGFLIAVASFLIAEHRFQGTRTQQLSFWVVKHRLSSCGPQVQLLCSMCDPPGPGTKQSPALLLLLFSC